MSMDKKKIIIAFLLLLMTVLINIPTLLNGTFVDEFDTLAAAKLMTTKGQILYRDIFSHHFPLSYYWTALIFKLFGTSVFVARMSLVGLYVFVFFTLMLLTKKWIELSLVSFIWGALRILYFGNMIIYPSFSAIFILGYGVLGLHALSLEEEPPWHYWPIMSFLQF